MARVTETNTFQLEGWPGGFRYDSSGYNSLQPDEVILSDFDIGPQGELTSRKGRHMLTAAWDEPRPWTTCLYNLFWFHDSSADTDFIIGASADGKVWRTGDGPDSTVVACNTATPTQVDLGSLSVESPPPAAAVLDDYFVITKCDSHAFYWAGGSGDTWVEVTDHTLNDGGVEATWEFPMAGSICSGFSRMWAGDVTDNATRYRSRLWWSGAVGTLKEGSADPAGPWNWPSTNWAEVNPEDGGTITKIVQYGQSILIFKEHSLYALVGAGDPSTATLYTVDNTVGCVYPGSVAVGGGKVFWNTADGAYQYDGTEVKLINRKILAHMQYFMGDPGVMQGCFSESKWHLSCPTDYRVIYNTLDNSWTYMRDGGGGVVVINDVIYTSPMGGGIATLDSHAGGSFDDWWDDHTLSTSYVTPTLSTGWLPPPSHRTGAQYRLRGLHIALGTTYSVGIGRLRVTITPEGGEDTYGTSTVYTYDLADVFRPEDTASYSALLRVPGSPHLASRFKLDMELYDATTSIGEVSPIIVLGVAMILSERPVKHNVLDIGVANV